MSPSISAAGVILALMLQQTPPAPRFKSSADLVQVDVSVVDGDGRPIRGLTAEDFELRVDGRRRAIASAQFVSVGSDVVMPAAATPAGFSSNAEAVGGRLVMIAVDRGSLAAGRGNAALDAASRFVAGLNRADRVALASIPAGPQIDFTANHELVRERLQQMDGDAVAGLGPRGIGIADALAFERKDQFVIESVLLRECGAGPGPNARSGAGGSDVVVCQNQVNLEASLVASDARDRARNSVIGLRALLDRMPPSATPKILVFISEGLVLEREYAQLSWLEAKAAAAHVTIYALHVAASEVEASRARPPARYAADRTALEDGLYLMTQVTRGDVFRVVANSDFAFRRLALELSGYYLLGFEPEARERNGRPHAIKVDVRRKGVTVRSRRQFAIGATKVATVDREIVAALRDPLPATEIPIKLTTYSFANAPAVATPSKGDGGTAGDGAGGNKLRLLVAADIDRSINSEGQISVGYVLVDFDGRLAASQLDTAVPAPASASKKRDRQTARYFSTVLASPGKYTLKLVVVDDAGRRGSVERLVQARLHAAGPIRATDLLVADDARAEGQAPLAPTVSGEFTGKTLHSYLELFADAPETLALTSVELEVVTAKTAETAPALARVPIALRTPAGDAHCRIAAARVDIADLAPGDYVARAVIAVGGRTVGTVSKEFRIQNSESRIQ